MNLIPVQTPIGLYQTREQFEREILEYCQPSFIQYRYEWRTREWINNKIRELDDNKISKKYEVDEVCGKKVLKFKEGVFRKNLQIVPIEDYFDIIYTAHIFTLHGILTRVKKYLLKKSLYVPNRAVNMFLQLCVPCNAPKAGNLLKTSYHAFLELIDLSDTPAGNDKFVLHYRALKMKRVIFRPLESKDVTKIVEQLLELFAGIGPPRTLHTPTNVLTKAIIFKLAIIYPDYKIICGREMHFHKKSKKIRRKIVDWMLYNKSIEWSTVISSLNGNHNFNKVKKAPALNVFGSISMGEEIKELSEEHVIASRSKSIKPTKEIDERVRALKSGLAYNNIVDAKTPQNSLAENSLADLIPSTPQSHTTYKTYGRKNNQKPQKICLAKNNEEQIEKKVLCIDRNLKETTSKPTKAMINDFRIWESTIDLPDMQTVSKKLETLVEMNTFNNINFGTISRGNVSLDADLLNNGDEKIDFLLDDRKTKSQIHMTHKTYVRKEKVKRQTILSNNSEPPRKKALCIKNNNTTIDNNINLSTIPKKDDVHLNEDKKLNLSLGSIIDERKDSCLTNHKLPETKLKNEIIDDFYEDNDFYEPFADQSDLSVLESKNIKIEPQLSEPENVFISLENNDIKLEEHSSFGKIIKTESIEE